jgi:hypothetical protein
MHRVRLPLSEYLMPHGLHSVAVPHGPGLHVVATLAPQKVHGIPERDLHVFFIF